MEVKECGRLRGPLRTALPRDLIGRPPDRLQKLVIDGTDALEYSSSGSDVGLNRGNGSYQSSSGHGGPNMQALNPA